MKTEILTIGNELLSGAIANTNSQFINRHLSAAGYVVSRQTSTSDDVETLHAILQESFERADLLICSGGIGSTCDDNTCQAVGKLLGVELEQNSDFLKHLEKTYGPDAKSMKESFIPKGGKAFYNDRGDAVSFMYQKEGKVIVLFPGFPHQLEDLLPNQILPYLLKNHPPKKKMFKKLFFTSE